MIWLWPTSKAQWTRYMDHASLVCFQMQKTHTLSQNLPFKPKVPQAPWYCQELAQWRGQSLPGGVPHPGQSLCLTSFAINRLSSFLSHNLVVSSHGNDEVNSFLVKSPTLGNPCLTTTLFYKRVILLSSLVVSSQSSEEVCPFLADHKPWTILASQWLCYQQLVNPLSQFGCVKSWHNEEVSPFLMQCRTPGNPCLSPALLSIACYPPLPQFGGVKSWHNEEVGPFLMQCRTPGNPCLSPAL